MSLSFNILLLLTLPKQNNSFRPTNENSFLPINYRIPNTHPGGCCWCVSYKTTHSPDTIASCVLLQFSRHLKNIPKSISCVFSPQPERRVNVARTVDHVLKVLAWSLRVNARPGGRVNAVRWSATNASPHRARTGPCASINWTVIYVLVP